MHNDKKLSTYLMQTGIKDLHKAQELIVAHLSNHANEYPYVLFRDNSLYFFTATGVSAVESMHAKNGNNYLRYDGERITQLNPAYYLGPKTADMTRETWSSDWNSNNNNNNNNNGNNNNG